MPATPSKNNVSDHNVSDHNAPAKKHDRKPYLVPYKAAIKSLGFTADLPDKFEITREQLDLFLADILRGFPVDEKWYLAKYPDIAEAVARGDIRSAKDHFVQDGYREGRLPGPAAVVDGEWYLRNYPDVAKSMSSGDFRSSQEHFDKHGRDEGRLPYRA